MDGRHETRAMKQEPTLAVGQDGRWWWRDCWQQADTLVAPLSERPLWCVAAGLLAGSLLGTAVDLPLVPLSGVLLCAGLLPAPALACATGATLLSPGSGGPGPDLAATRLAHRTPCLRTTSCVSCRPCRNT